MMEIISFTEGYLEMLRSFVRSSPVRRKIIFLLMKKEGLTKSQLKEELGKRGDKYNYRTIWQHVSILENLGIAKTEKLEHEPGKPVKVSLTKVVFKNQDRIKNALLKDYPHTKIPEEEKRKYL